MDDDADTDFIDTNYIWQRRIKRVLKHSDISTQFPYASALGVEFNPTFERAEKIPANLLTNGVILDIHDFVKAANKAACLHLFDVLQFNFDLGLEPDSPECFDFAQQLYPSVKLLHNSSQLRNHPKPLEKMQDVYVLPEVTPRNTELPSEKQKTLILKENLELDDDRKGDPIFIKKGLGQPFKLSMRNYPLCKNLGITFVLRRSHAPAHKLSTTLLTTGMVLEMLDFAEILSGRYLQLLKDLISHNFGEVYESCYLSTQVQALYDSKVTLLGSERELFCTQPFEFILKKKKMKRAAAADSEVEIPEKRRSVTDLSNDFFWEEKAAVEESSYMCPVEFDADPEDAEVDVESVFPESKTASKRLEEETEIPPSYYGFHKRRLRKLPTLQISRIFSDDTLPMQQKSVKQKEWAMRTCRITEILSRETRSNLMFCRSREIGLDFNVGSGRAKNLDMQLLTNHTLYEVHRFCSHLSRSMLNYLFNVMEINFNFVFQENFPSYLYTKEKCVANQQHTEELLNTPIHFPEIYNVPDMTGDGQSEDEPSGEDLSDEFPYCKRIGVNLWSSKGRPPGKKLSLNTLTYGALLEIFSLTRRLCSKPRDLMHDVLEHNFDVDLQDPTSDEANGLRKWLIVNRFLIKKPFSAIKTNMWLIEVVNLQQYGTTSHQRSSSEAASPLPKPKECTYEICKEIGLDLNLSGKSVTKQKLDMKLLTRGALFEVHNFVEAKCNRYVPALYEILDHNFDLSSQRHRRVEFAWSIAAQTLAMVRKGGRGGEYMQQVFELPFESEEGEVCKREEDEREMEATEEGGDEVLFVRKLIPVDIDVEIE